MLQALTVAGTVLAMLVPTVVRPTTTTTTVDVVSSNGSGCPAGMVVVWADPDNTWLSMYYGDRYIARVGANTAPIDPRQYCTLVLRVTPPEGYTYAITSVDHRGTAIMEPGAYGYWQAVHHFDGDPAPEPVRHNFTGPMDEQWVRSEQADPDALVWASCDTRPTLVITSRLLIYAGTSDPTTTSLLAMEGVDIVPNHYQFALRRC